MADQDDRQEQPVGDQPAKLSFFEELKRRKIFRVAITYGVVSWIIIQVAATTFGSFGIPEWAFRFVVLMVLLGFPVAVILAWAFEVTPEGVRKTLAAGSLEGDAAAPSLNRQRNWYALGMAAALPTLIFGTLAIIFYFNRAPVPIGTATTQSVQDDGSYHIGTIAVLPFTLFSEDSGLRSTADGIQDEMLTVLSEMNPLNVVSRTSTLQFSSETNSMPEIGEILGADFIVEGSIQTVGDKYSITVQLIHASDDGHIWAQSFDKSPERLGEPLVFQKEIAFELAINIYQSLEKIYPPTGKVKQQREQLITSLETSMTEDFTSFWGNWREENWEATYDSVLKQIDAILIIDPDNAVAHDANAAIRNQAPEVGRRSFYDPEWHKEYYLTLKRSYAIVPDGFDTNKHLGVYYYYMMNEPQKALPYSRNAVKLDKETRGEVDIYTYWVLLEALCATGQSAAAIRISEEATASGLTHFSGPAWFWMRGQQMLRKYEEQLAFFRGQLKIAEEENKNFDARFYAFRIAAIEAEWSGSMRPISDYIEQLKMEPDVHSGFMSILAFWMKDYSTMLEYLSDVEIGTSWSDLMSIDRARASGWAYLRMGNRPLANSYFKGYLNELQSSLKGRWMEHYQPDVYAASQAYGNACMGNPQEALEWVDKALQYADPTRQFEDYFNTMYNLVITFAVLGDAERSCELIDQMLSSPSGYSVGRFLIDPLFEDLLDSPLFEAVIRKYADQLKDPAILDTIF